MLLHKEEMIKTFVKWLFYRVCIKPELDKARNELAQEVEVISWDEPVIEFTPDAELLAKMAKERVH